MRLFIRVHGRNTIGLTKENVVHSSQIKSMFEAQVSILAGDPWEVWVWQNSWQPRQQVNPWIENVLFVPGMCAKMIGSLMA